VRPGERGPARFGAAANSAAGNDQETAALLARWREGYARLADLSGRQLALVKDVVPAVKPAGAAENGEASPKTADAVLEGAYDDLWFRLGMPGGRERGRSAASWNACRMNSAGGSARRN